MPVRPKHKASAVTALGATARSGRPRCVRWGRGRLIESSPLLSNTARRTHVGPTKHGFAGDAALAEGDLRGDIVRKIDIDSAAEADQPDTLAGRDHVTRLDERHDPTRDETGNLGETDTSPAPALDDDMLTLI